MAIPKVNLLSLGHLSGTGTDTLSKQRERSGKNSDNKPSGLSTRDLGSESQRRLTVMHLQQRLQELKERERMAQQRNRQLLQQFEEAQDTLKEMMASNTAMKTIRIEYERYLQDNGPHWQQQFKEKCQRAHEKRMNDHQRSALKSSEVTKSTHRHITSQGPVAPKKYSNYNQEPWLSHTQSQSTSLPPRTPYQARSSSHVPSSLVPPPTFLHLQPFPLHNFTSATDDQKPWSTQEPPGWATLQADHSGLRATGLAGLVSASECLLGHLGLEKPPPEVKEDEEISRASNSKGDRQRRANNSTQELDMRPVRLSSGHPDSSESGRDSSLRSTEGKEKKKKKKRRGRSPSSSEKRSSPEVSTTSCAPETAPVTLAQSSESDMSSEKGHTNGSSVRVKKRGEPAAGPQKPMKEEKEETRRTRKNAESPRETSEHTEKEEEEEEERASEKSRSESPEDKSVGSVEEQEGSENLKIKSGAANELEESSSSEKSSSEEKDGKERKKEEEAEEEDGDGERDTDKLNGGGDEVSARKDTTEEETDAEEEDEMDIKEDDEEPSNRVENRDPEEGKLDSASSQDEVEDEDGSEGSEEEEEGSEEDEEHIGDEGREPVEDRDSDDSIISPQERRPKQMQIIPEEGGDDDEGEEEEESAEGSSEDASSGSSDEDIEKLLSPKEPQNKEEEDQKSEDESTVIRDTVMIFQVQRDSPKSNRQSDSDEFDHFYD